MLVANESECIVKPAESEKEPIFAWDTMREVGQETPHYQTGAIPGYLGYSTRLQSKNGSKPEANLTLDRPRHGFQL